MREAVESQRTIASFNDVLVGMEELLRQFVSACLELRTVVEAGGRYEILNRSDLTFELMAGEVYYRIDPNATIRFTLKKPQPMVLKKLFHLPRRAVADELVGSL